MSTITFSRDQARYLVDVALSASSSDDVTPVICGAHVTVEDGKLRVVCTDRYRAHTALIEAVAIDGELSFIIPRKALLWLRKNLAYYGSYARELHRIVITVTPHPEGSVLLGTLLVSVKEYEGDDAAFIQWSGEHVKGKFPPVITLIEKARNAEAVLAIPRVRLDYLGRMGALGRFGPEFSPQIKFTPSDNPNKSGPIYASWRENAQGAPYAEAIIQPNLELP